MLIAVRSPLRPDLCTSEKGRGLVAGEPRCAGESFQRLMQATRDGARSTRGRGEDLVGPQALAARPLPAFVVDAISRTTSGPPVRPRRSRPNAATIARRSFWTHPSRQRRARPVGLLQCALRGSGGPAESAGHWHVPYPTWGPGTGVHCRSSTTVVVGTASRVEAKAYRESRIAQGMLAQKRRTDRVYRKPEAYPDCVVCGETVLNGMVRSDAPMHNSCRPSGRQIAISKKDRLKIYMRDRLICQLCDSTVDLNLPTTDRWAATLDHIIPYSLGGSDDESNLRLTHRSCNSRRGAPSEAAEAAA